MSSLNIKKNRGKTSKGKEEAIAAATKPDYTRMQILVEKELHKKFFLKARMSGSDMSKVINAWIREFVDE